MKRIKAWAVTSKVTPLYWLGESRQHPYAIFEKPEEAFEYFVHLSDFGEETMCIVPVTIEVPEPNKKHTYSVYLPHLPPLECNCERCEPSLKKRLKKMTS